MGIVTLIGVFIGGGAGSLLRHGLILFFGGNSLSVSVTILFVNVAGSSALGYLAGGGGSLSSWQFLSLAVGLLGGFTTFSTFSMDIVKTFANGGISTAVLFIVANNLLSILGCHYFWQLSLRNAV